MSTLSTETHIDKVCRIIDSKQAVDLSMFSRQPRLDIINGFLAKNSLRPLEGLGDASHGQIEFVGINGFSPDPVKPGAFVTRVDFQANQAKPGGFNHLCYFNAGATTHSGVVVVPIINDEFVLMVQQFRPVVGRTTIEVPRGFSADLGDPNQIKSYGAAVIELKQETGIDLATVNHKVREEVMLDENTGTSNIVNANLAIDISLSNEEMAALKNRVMRDGDEINHTLKSILIPKKMLIDVVSDNHTGAALFKLLCKDLF